MRRSANLALHPGRLGVTLDALDAAHAARDVDFHALCSAFAAVRQAAKEHDKQGEAVAEEVEFSGNLRMPRPAALRLVKPMPLRATTV